MNASAVSGAASHAADALMAQAIKHYSAGNAPEAERLAMEACVQEPAHPDALNLLGALACERGDIFSATRFLTRAMESDPANPHYPFNLAVIYEGAGRQEELKAMLDRVLSLQPTHSEALQRRLKIAVEEKDYPVMEHHSRVLDSMLPGRPEIERLLAFSLIQQSKFCDAEPILRRIYKSDKRQDIAFFNSFTAALSRLGKFGESIQVGEAAIQQGLGDENLHYTIGKACEFTGLNEKAREHFELALKYSPEMTEATAAMVLFNLKCSNLTQNLAGYRKRFLYQMSKDRSYPFPCWKGEPLAGKKILIWAEQGIGDVIMFGGFIPGILAEGAEITFSVYERMIKMFRRSFPSGVQIEPLYEGEGEDPLAAQPFDFHCSLGDLMIYRLTAAPPVRYPGFLKPDISRVNAIRTRYDHDIPGFRLGIAWHTTNEMNGIPRNIPLAQWRPLFNIPDIQVVSLQYGDHREETEAFSRETGHRLYEDPEIDQLFHPEDFVDQVAALDAVVSIQNSAVHVTGALGMPVAMLLSAASDFRWGVGRTDNPWYPGVTILRQEHYGDWRHVMAQAVKYVEGKINPIL